MAQQVKIVLTDPWDLVTVAGSDHSGEIVARTENGEMPGAILVRLHAPFPAFGQVFEHLLVTPRHEGDSLLSALTKKFVTCNLLRMPREIIEGPNPFDTSWYRGGSNAAIGDIALGDDIQS